MPAHAGMASAKTLACPFYEVFRLRIQCADRASEAGIWSIANSYEAYRNLVLEFKKGMAHSGTHHESAMFFDASQKVAVDRKRTRFLMLGNL